MLHSRFARTLAALAAASALFAGASHAQGKSDNTWVAPAAQSAGDDAAAPSFSEQSLPQQGLLRDWSDDVRAGSADDWLRGSGSGDGLREHVGGEHRHHEWDDDHVWLSSAPEPAAWLLMAAGVGGLVVFVRRRARRS